MERNVFILQEDRKRLTEDIYSFKRVKELTEGNDADIYILNKDTDEQFDEFMFMREKNISKNPHIEPFNYMHLWVTISSIEWMVV